MESARAWFIRPVFTRSAANALRSFSNSGEATNLASRLVDVAAPDMVVVDEGYRRVLGEQDASVSFEALESQDLKGIGDTEMWRLDRPVPPIV